MNILVTGANGQLGNEMCIVTKDSKDRYIFTDVCDEHPESLELLQKLAGDEADVTTTKLDISMDYVFGGDPYNTPCKEDQKGNEGVCSWYDFTKMIQQVAVGLETPETSETMGTHGACYVCPCHSDEFPSPVKRPAYSVCDKTKIKSEFRKDIPYWTISLGFYIENLKAYYM